MDFDDLDAVEAAAGPTPDERREELLAQALPEKKSFPLPVSRNFGSGGKLKMLFLYGGGVNQKVAKMQISNVFRESPMFKNMEFSVLEAPCEAELTWHTGEQMRAQLRPFGPHIYLYFDRLPYANCQWESWEGIEASFEALREHFQQHGPYDGVCGFDMGGEVLVHAARMAQELGDPGFARMFRFMVLFTSGSTKHLSVMGLQGKRPKAPLRIPAVISWSDKDENHPYTWYEETALFFAPEFREVITHSHGHIPPRLARGSDEIERLTNFLEAMWNDTRWEPSDHPDNAWNRNIWLPLQRAAPKSSPSSASRRRLLVVPDPMGTHDYERRAKGLAQAIAGGLMHAGKEPEPFKAQGLPDVLANAKMDFEVSALTVEDFKQLVAAGVSVETVEYSDEQRRYDWHCREEEILNGQMKREDIILAGHQELEARKWADQLLRDFAIEPDEAVGLVGIGTGAFLAFAMAKHLMRERRQVPAGLWLADPPTRLPFESTMSPGALVDCPVRVLTHSTSVVGPPWRWEVSTCGPFSMATFQDVKELLRMVLSEFDAL